MTSKPPFGGERVPMSALLQDSFSGEWGKAAGPALTPVLRTANFNEDGTLDYATPAMRCIPDKKVQAKRMQRGDIILEKSGGTPNRPVGILAYYDSDELALCSNFNQVLRFNPLKMIPRYAFYQLRWLKEKNAFDRYTRKTTGLQNLEMKRFGELEMLVPGLPVQQRAADTLDKIIGIRHLLDTQIAALDALVKSRFAEMFGNPNDKGLRWQRRRLDSFSTIITGNTPSRRKPEYYGDYIEWIKTDNITAATTLTRAAEGLSEAGAKAGRTAPGGSVLMACIAGSVKSIGKVAIADRDVAFNQQINAIIPDDDVLTEYLYWMLSLSKDYLCSDINMQLKGILNKTTLSKKEFPLPPLSLQREFADFASRVDKLRVDAQTQKERLQTLYDSLAQEYFAI